MGNIQIESDRQCSFVKWHFLDSDAPKWCFHLKRVWLPYKCRQSSCLFFEIISIIGHSLHLLVKHLYSLLCLIRSCLLQEIQSLVSVLLLWKAFQAQALNLFKQCVQMHINDSQYVFFDFLEVLMKGLLLDERTSLLIESLQHLIGGWACLSNSHPCYSYNHFFEQHSVRKTQKLLINGHITVSNT